jgi:NADPH:quinone reductase-like Zn-dependent oxidoreductase
MGRQIHARALSPFVRQRLTTFVSRHRQADLEELRQLVEAGQVTPVVDRTYPMEDVPDAIRHLEARLARGKIAIRI